MNSSRKNSRSQATIERPYCGKLLAKSQYHHGNLNPRFRWIWKQSFSARWPNLATTDMHRPKLWWTTSSVFFRENPRSPGGPRSSSEPANGPDVTDRL